MCPMMYEQNGSSLGLAGNNVMCLILLNVSIATSRQQELWNDLLTCSGSISQNSPNPQPPSQSQSSQAKLLKPMYYRPWIGNEADQSTNCLQSPASRWCILRISPSMRAPLEISSARSMNLFCHTSYAFHPA